MDISPSNQLEIELRRQGVGCIAGVDEVGRGALAGPVVTAAVILPDDPPVKGIRDSKLIREPERERLYGEITACALAWSVGMADNREIDRINILQATLVSMGRAVAELTLLPDMVLVDGRDRPAIDRPCRAVIRGDAHCRSIAAAAIIAKVTRDRMMRSSAEIYPHYGFQRNKGYGTAEHRRAILEHGPTPIHRHSFLTKLQQQTLPLD